MCKFFLIFRLETYCIISNVEKIRKVLFEMFSIYQSFLSLKQCKKDFEGMKMKKQNEKHKSFSVTPLEAPRKLIF